MRTSYSTEYKSHLEKISEIYKIIVSDPTSLELYNVFSQLFDLYVMDEYIVNPENILKVNNAFDDKTIVAEFFRFLLKNENLLDNIGQANRSILLSYLEKARQYFVDDRALFSSMITLINEIDPAKLKYGDEKSIIRIINKKLEQDKKSNGIYNVDQATLQEMDRKIDKLGVLSGRITALIETADKQMKELSESTKTHSDLLTEARIEELKILSDEANKIIKNFNASYLELLGKQKETIINERDIIIAEIDRLLEQRKIELDNYANQIAQRVALELRRIRNVSQESIHRIETFLTDNDEVKKLIGEAQNNGDFIKKLQEIEMLATAINIPTVNTVKVQTQPQAQGTSSSGNVSVLDSLYLPTIIIPQESRNENSPVNYYFDKNIPYKERFNELMEKKQKLIEKGEIFHEKFDDILTMILQNDAPYIYGPSGCGKTYMVQNQMAKLLDMNVVSSGYVLYEQDIIGYTNSGTGGYVPSNFYRCYKFGDTHFFDEFDKGVSNATTILNSFLSGSDDEKFTFPNGERVNRHKNFRIITAGNTKGSGKTLAHNTSQKMDESVMQRLTPIEVGYDNRIEQKILADYPGWYDFAINFRKAIESIPSDSGEEINTIGTFTTRDAQSVKKYKDDDAMTDEQLIDYEIIENKDIDYLNQLKKRLIGLEEEGSFITEEGHALLRTFKMKVDNGKKR